MADSVQQTAKEALDNVREQRIPKAVRDAAKEGVEKSREVYDRVSGLTKDNVRDAERMMAASYDAAKEVSGTMLRHFAVNTDAAFEAARALAQAHTIPEASQIYMDLTQKQMTALGQQLQELQDVSIKAMQSTFGSLQATASRGR